MIKVDLTQAEEQFFELVEAAIRGEEVVLCRDGVEVAEIQRIDRAESGSSDQPESDKLPNNPL